MYIKNERLVLLLIFILLLIILRNHINEAFTNI